jgi:hypothetical protein
MSEIVLGKAVHGGGLVRLDVQRLIESRLLLQANSGGGKSWAIRRLLEQSHGQVQHLVLDIEGEFHTLREQHDYVLAARAGADTLADPRTATLLAKRLLELGVSAILDLYELKAAARVTFVKLFLEALIDAPRALWHPALVVVDEAHHFCPEQGGAESAAAVIDLMTRGRKRGFCGVLATQRLSKLSKDAAAEANVKLIGRAALDVDMKRAAVELGLSGKEDLAHLRSLPAGHFFAFGPGLSDEVVEVVVGPVKTTHPRPGQRAAPVPPAREKVQKVLAQLADLPKEAEAEARTAAELRGEVVALKRQLAAKPAAAPVPDKVVERPVLKDAQVQRLTADAEKLIRLADGLRADAVKLQAHGNEIIAALAASTKGPQPTRALAGGGGSGAAIRAARPSRPAPVVSNPGEREAYPPARLRILDALAFLEGIGIQRADRGQLAFLSDQSPSSSSYVNNLGALRTAGVVTYPSEGAVALTDAGRAVADSGRVPSTTDELHAAVRSKLSPARWRILDALIAEYPNAASREDLAEAAGASATSSSFVNNLGALRTLGLIDYPAQGRVAACPVLFLEGR